MAESPHAEFIATPTELYTLLDTLGAVSHCPPLLAPYYDINTSAAEAAGYTPQSVSLMCDLPYLDVELYDRAFELEPNTYPVSYLSASNECDFEFLREMLHDESMPCSIRFTNTVRRVSQHPRKMLFRLANNAVRRVEIITRLHFQPPRFFSMSSSWSWSKDPIIRRQQYERFHARSRERYASDEEFENKKKQSIRNSRAKWTTQRHQQYRAYLSFVVWVKHLLKAGEPLVWKNHVAELTEKSVVHNCDGCNSFGRRGRLWWHRKDTGEYDCTGCFTKDWSRVHPVGYEHLVFPLRENRKAASKEPSVLPDSSTKPKP